MSNIARGKTTKLSIYLTEQAHKEIERIGKNLNLSKAGVILFSLSKIRKQMPTNQHLEELDEKYTLSKTHFSLTISKEIAMELTDLTKTVDMSKGKWIGLVVSDYFEQRKEGELQDPKRNTSTFRLQVLINVDLKRRIVEYSEKNYIAFSGLVSAACIDGPYEKLPEYETEAQELLTTNVPIYIHKKIKKEAAEIGLSENFYVELCLYKVFMGENKKFV